MKKGKKSITADLTPLLDVIFILLFLVLIKNADTVEAARKEAAEAQKEAEQETMLAQQQAQELEEQREALEGEIAQYATLLEGSAVVYIEIQMADEARTLIVKEGAHTEQYEYDWDGLRSGMAGSFLNQTLIRRLGSAEDGVPSYLVFQYNGNELYMDDYRMVTGVLELMSHKTDVYVQYRDMAVNVK